MDAQEVLILAVAVCSGLAIGQARIEEKVCTWMCEIHQFINGVAELDRSGLTAEVIDRSHDQGSDSLHSSVQVLRLVRLVLGRLHLPLLIKTSDSRSQSLGNAANSGYISDRVAKQFQRAVRFNRIVVLRYLGVAGSPRGAMSTLNTGLMVF